MLIPRFFAFGLLGMFLVFATEVGQAQSVKVITDFSGQPSTLPGGSLVQGRNGQLYGGTDSFAGSDGTIFQLSTRGTLGFLHTFDSTDGAQPQGLTLATDGNLYGVTSSGGTSNSGVLYRLSPNGTYATLHEFSGGSDGGSPIASPVEATDGSIYGVTLGSFVLASTLYRYTPQSGSFATIYTFDEAHGQYASHLIEGTDGSLYGTAIWGGNSQCGTAFKITTSGTPLWAYSFPCGTGGYNPEMLLQAADGNFYGVTANGGDCLFCGTIFKSDNQGQISTLYSLPPTLVHGANPAILVQGTDGNLYGVTIAGGQFSNGTVFKMTTSGTYTVLYSLDSATTGGTPAGLMQHTNGLLYGTAQAGGTSSNGTVYSFNARLSPFVAFVVPAGRSGQTAQILGQGLTGTTSVTFNGVPATTFTVVNNTYMTAVVPSGATTGKVVVTTPGGALTSNVNFRIIN
jgi:uncharacterized repeat protein (TIGR03803 family)